MKSATNSSTNTEPNCAAVWLLRVDSFVRAVLRRVMVTSGRIIFGAGDLQQLSFSKTHPPSAAFAWRIAIGLLAYGTLGSVKAGDLPSNRVELFKRFVAGGVNVAHFAATRIQELPPGIQATKSASGEWEAYYVGALQNQTFWIANTVERSSSTVFLGTNINWIVGVCEGQLWTGGFNFFQEIQSVKNPSNDPVLMVAVMGRKFVARTLGMGLRQDLDEQIRFDGTNFVTKAGTSVTITGYLVIPEAQDKVSAAICRFPSSGFRGHARVEYEYDANATSGDLPTAFVGTAFSEEGKSWRSDDVRLIDIRIVNDPIDSSAFCPKAFVNHDSADRPLHIIITNSQPMLVTSNGLEIITVARQNGSSALAVTIISALALSGIGYLAMALVKNRQTRK